MKSKITGFIAAALFLTVIFCGQNLNAQITITAENTIEIGSNETITLSATGNDAVSGVTLVTAVNNNDGSGPSIVDVLGLGIFDGVAPVFSNGADPQSSPMAIIANIEQGGSQLIDPSEFASLSFDTSALEVGDEFFFGLTFGPQNTTFTNDTNQADPSVETIFQLTFPVTVVSSIPEPSSLALLLATSGFAVLRRRKVA